jgi:hypothetical protein
MDIYDKQAMLCISDLNSHADASVVGMEVITFQDFERPVNISGYDP